MANTKTKLTGLDAASVYVMEQLGEKTQPVLVTIGRGDELPDNLKSGEKERLDKLGAFEDKTPAEKTREEQVRAAAVRAQSQADLAATNAGLAAGSTTTTTTQKPYGDMNVSEAIAYLETLPEGEREPYFDKERDAERQGVLKHFDKE